MQASKTVYCFVRDYTVLYNIKIFYSVSQVSEHVTQIFVQPCTCTFVQVHFKYEPVNNHLIDNSLNSLCRTNNSIKPQAPDIIYFSHSKEYAPSTYNNNCILIGRAYIFFIMRKIYCIIGWRVHMFYCGENMQRQVPVN